MENLNDILNELGLEKQITLDDIPQIDLYMDQVIQLFEKKFSETKRNDDEKVMTKTMINNYAKGKLLFPIKKKKYSKEHILLISLIYQMKGALSINDIKSALSGLNHQVEKESIDLEAFYQSYLHLMEQNGERFKKDVDMRVQEVLELSAEKKNSEDAEQLLLIMSLVNISNSYRKVAERLIDNLTQSKS